MNQACQTPTKDLKIHALKHYEEASLSIHCWLNSIPKAITFYYDYQTLTLWNKIKLAFQIKRKTY